VAKRKRHRRAARRRAHGVSIVEPRPRPLAIEAVVRRIAVKAVTRAKRAGTLPAMRRAGEETARQLVAGEQVRQRARRDQELHRLDDHEVTAKRWRDEAAGQLQALSLSPPLDSALSEGGTRLEFAEIPEAAKPLNWVWRATSRLLERIGEARWALEQLQQPAPDRLTPAQCHQIADTALVEIERLANRLTRLKLEAQLSRFRGRGDAITRHLAVLVQANRQAPRRELWRRLAGQLGCQVVPVTANGDEELLRDAEGRVQITYSQFTKRLDRAKQKRPRTPI
jgi:hypothetical protein